ncbi:MAG: transcription antitermination factor NusB [Paludibacteraceae bacterium]|nr:transcription antitermination factor NusB [Paludibacteraceae bacterium]
MINRTMVRQKVLQTLYAYYKDEDSTALRAQKHLLKSFNDSYSLYMELLLFVDELTRYAEEQISEQSARAKATHTTFIPNRRFVENKFAAQLFTNRALRSYADQQHLSWDAGHSAVAAVYKQLVGADFYKTYMTAEDCGYDDDKMVWRKIFTNLVLGNDEVDTALDDLEVALNTQNWSTDLDLVTSFVIKTIKRFDQANGADQALLPIFDDEHELEFGKDLLKECMDHHDEYEALMAQHLKNWDASRIAYVDTIIIVMALTEILNFAEIPLEISLNEYIELAKEFSSEKSYQFINGIISEIYKSIKQQ